MKARVKIEGFYDGSICRVGKVVELPEKPEIDPRAFERLDQPPTLVTRAKRPAKVTIETLA
jgi:hypothetical protein